MAISLSAAAIPSLKPELSVGSSSSTKLSSLSSLGGRFPAVARRARIAIRRSSFSTVRNSPIVASKKETFSSFDDLLAKSDKPVLVDFYATWCGPCQFMVPILDEVSIALNDKIQVVKIDTEKYPSIANKYRIEALPTLMIFKDGKPHDRFEGALTAQQLIQRIEESLKMKK